MGRLALVLFALLLGCQPGIGDDCQSSADCSAGGDRLCDITQPGGYCTIFNCEPGSCPEDSVCVLFSSDRSTVSGCQDAAGTSPFQRSFCMKTCEGNGDCRSAYECIDVDVPGNPWGAVLVDSGPGRVCVVPYSAAQLPDDRSGEVCTGSDAELEPPPVQSGGGSGGDSGSAGAGGEGGAPATSMAGAGGA